jgi:NitT/TauT family transport system substrate-binding protein
MRRAILHAVTATSVIQLVIICAGCGGGGSSQAAPAVEKPNITVGAVPVADEAGLYIALDRGLFKAEGLNVKIVPIVSSADIIRDQNDGTFDITAGACVSYVQEIADTDRVAVEQAIEKLPAPYTVPPEIAAIMPLENYPLNIAPDVDLTRVQRVADTMHQFQMLSHPSRVSSMLG